MAKPTDPTDATAVVDGPPDLPQEPSPPPLLAPGATVGRYVIVEPLGEGGMGVVYVAEDPGLGRRVAVKLLRTELLDQEAGSQGRDRLVREAHAMAKLNHPNVVTIYDSGTFDDQVFLAVELVKGTTVKAWLAREPRPWREVLDVFLKAGRGLAAAHAAGIVHRDFKPENVLLSDDGAVKVIDFGLARAAGAPTRVTPGMDLPHARAAALSEEVLATPLTQAGVISGTPAYMAPEQLAGEGSDARTDEFNFSVALYRALYDELPFDRSLDGEARWRVRPLARRTAVPDWVRRPILRGLSFAPEERYPSLVDLLDALSTDPGVRRRKVVGLTGLAVLVVAVAVASAGAVMRRQAAMDPCHDPESKLTGVWDDGARGRLRAAFAATGSPDAPAIGAYVEKHMDRAATAWLASYREACDATRVLHTQPEAALQLRLDCLDDARLDVRSITELVTHPDPRKLRSTIGATGGLPVVSACADPTALEVAQPIAPERRTEVESLRKRLSDGRALVGASRSKEALEVLKPLPDAAQKLGARGLEIRALLALGNAYAAAGGVDDQKTCLALNEKAAALAEAARLDRQATEAAATIAQVGTLVGRPRAEVDGWVERAKTSLERAGGSARASYDVEHALANVEMIRGHGAEAARHGRRAMELAEQIWGGDDYATLNSANNLAAVLDPLGEYDEENALYRRAISGLSAMFGPQSHAPLTPEMNLAETLFDLGKLDLAQKSVDNVLARLGSDESPEGATVEAIQAALSAIAGKRDESQRSLRHAFEVGERLHVLENPGWADFHRFAIEAMVRSGEPERGVADYERYCAKQDFEADSPNWVAYLRDGGWAYLAAGKPKKALPMLERALVLSRAHPFFPGWVAQLEFQIAQALTASAGAGAGAKEARRRAEALATAAHDELAHVEVRRALLAEVDAWRDKTFGR